MDEADKILAELLARDGAMSRTELRKQALEAMREVGENPNTPMGREFLKHQMISIAAKDDAEADALLARAHGMAPPKRATKEELAALPDDLKRAACEAVEGMAEISRKRRGGSSLH
jgi:hypothetical protein